MKLSEIIDVNNIMPDLRCADKKGVLEELANAVSNHEPSIEKGALVKVLVERERLGTTGIGDGVAIPHGKMKGVSKPVISFGRCKDGVDFDSIDGQPAYLFCLLVAPENSSSVHLQVLAKIAKLLKSNALRKKLMEAKDREEIYQTIIQSDEESL
jgi:PTS system nitrogen regulatory IIA component